MPQKKRGGRLQNEKGEEQNENFENDILNYKCREAHCSIRQTCRFYLPPELNIAEYGNNIVIVT